MSETAAHTTADAGRTEPVAFITKAALENWLKGDCPENHVFLRTGGDLRVALYMHPPEPTDELTGCREALRKATIKNAKSDAMIADLNDMVLRYAYRAEITSADREAVKEFIASASFASRSSLDSDTIFCEIYTPGYQPAKKGSFGFFVKELRAILSLLSGAGMKSASLLLAPHNSGEREPSVMPDSGEADTKSDGGSHT